MRKFTIPRHLLASFFFCISFIFITATVRAQCNIVAYSGVANNGNQNYPQRLGMTFTVNSPISITDLGVFDDGQDGLSTTIQVGIIRSSDGVTVVGPISISGASDPLQAKHRIRPVTPVTLSAGDYIIVAVGFDDNNLNGNNATTGYPAPITDGGGGLITFGASSYGGVGFGRPTIPDENSYHAGTFKYSVDSPDTDGDGIGNACDADDDNDGVLDANDNCPLVANPNQADNDHDGIGDVCDTDDDNDGVLDANDNCPLVANSDQADNDHDGIGDVCDTDDDNDGVLDANDNCPLVANPNQADNDHDGIGDVCDTDDDNDGVPDVSDNCPLVANPNQADVNHNGIGDVCETNVDTDKDGVPDAKDNCPLVANPNQADNDHDGIGDVCDPDDDNDGVPDVKDNCPLTANPNQADNDHDGKGDVCDTDDDNDGVPDTKDNCPLTFNPFQIDIDHDGIGDACDPDDDNDGVPDVKDNCSFIANPNQADLDHDGIGDACDLDIDGDGVLNVFDCAPLDKNNNKWLVCHKGQTLCVAQSEVKTHLLHGDYPGACFGIKATNEISSVQKEVELPEKLRVTNYPNPFTNHTTIVYDLPFDSKVSLKIYDILGRVVATLVNEDKKAGTYKADFDAAKSGTGNFFYRINAITKEKQFTQTGSMLRLK